ncbi:protein AKNAD1 [Erinaceus europaeus]|uniref:Protein AKNAD1 n=1 Tax=Erinaceus europaeus TaxID=9365 RepID=A0ABM3YA52_ERIEU|nr:protein AKNAD1 [Erinaceus europaeus]
MDETDFSEDTTSKQQDELPYDGKIDMYEDYNPTSKNILDISNPSMFAVDDPQLKTIHTDACRNKNKMIDGSTNKKHDMEKLYLTDLHTPANKRDASTSDISDSLLRHLSKEKCYRSPGITCETLPQTSNAASFDEITKNIILHYAKYYWPKKQTPGLTDQLSSKMGDENDDKLCWSSTITEGDASAFKEPVATEDSNHQENSKFLIKVKTLSERPQSCQGQAPQKQRIEETSSDSGLKDDQGCAQWPFSDFLKVTPNVNIPKNNLVNRSSGKQPRILPKFRDKSAIKQDILDSMSRTNYIKKQDQKKKTAEFSQQTQIEPTFHIHQEYLTGTEPETSFFKLPSTFQKDYSSSSYIFQKISQGKQMCEELKEKTDQLKTKVQEFSQSIRQDSAYHLQDGRQILKKLQGHLDLVEQEFLATKEEHLTLQQQVYKHASPAASVFDPERKVEGEIFNLEMLLEDIKEKSDKDKYISAPSLPVSSSVLLDALAPMSSPPSSEEDPNSTSPRQDHVEITSPSCVFCQQVLEWQQKMEKKDHRKINRGKFPFVIPEKALYWDSILNSDTGHSCYNYSTEPKSIKCENCGTEFHSFPGVCSKEPFQEFHYRYNIPGESYLNHGKRSTFGQLCFLNENKNSSSSCPEPKGSYSQRTNSKFSQDKYEPLSGEKIHKPFVTYSADLATPSPHFHSCKISGSKPLCNASSTKRMESDTLNTSLDYALRTTTILKETTEQMIKAIAEDLAKVKRWRNRLRH